mgnify:CR=1 FL=1
MRLNTTDLILSAIRIKFDTAIASELGNSEFGIIRHNSGPIVIYTGTSDDLIVKSSGTDRMRMGGNGRLHIYPSGSADVDLEVSNGSNIGGGTAHAVSFAAHSSAKLKSDIRYLTMFELAQYYAEIKTLKLAEFRYTVGGSSDTLKKDVEQPMRKGLIFEDVPESLKSPHETVSLNDQIFMLQAAMKVLIEKVEKLDSQ